MDVPLRKVTTTIDLRARPKSRPSSPANLKHSPTAPAFRPKAKLNTDVALRKPSSSSALASRASHVPLPSRSRPNSPFKPTRILPTASEPGGSPKARVTARPIPVRPNSGQLEPRQRALTAASPKLKPPHVVEDRPRSGSVIALHHALPISDIDTYSSTSPTLSHPSPLANPPRPLVDISRANTPPVPVKIKSKVTGIVKPTATTPADAASRSLSPPYATTRPVHARIRAPSITSSFLSNDNDAASLTFYPITTASPAANPHRYVPLRAPSPARSFPSPATSSEPHPARNASLVAKVDSVAVPPPPHSPPISALSFSSKSSVSRTSMSPNTDPSTDNYTSGVGVASRLMERIGQPNSVFSLADINLATKRDRSRSRERSPRGDSDTEPEGPERQLRAEAKTNRKIADLEITNRSLLAINASLETTKNRQAKEIRDLRRRLRETRLILPPRTYKAVTSALEEEHERDEHEDEDDSDVEEGVDEAFQRVKVLIDSLIESGKTALETRPEDLRAGLATKVLNADELRSWRESDHRASTSNHSMDTHDTDDKTVQGLLSPALIAVPDNDNISPPESDEELASDSHGPSALPPTLTITPS